MKLLHTADLHLGALLKEVSLGRKADVRLGDFLKNLDKMVEDAIRSGCDFFVISGDVFHSWRPQNKVFYEFSERVGRLTDKGIHVIVIAGNHDKPKFLGEKNVMEALVAAHAPYFHYRHVVRGQEPLVLNTRDGKKVGFVLLPYVPYKALAKLGSETPHEDFRRSVEKLVSQQLNSRKLSDVDYKVLVAHVLFKGSQLSSESR